MDPRRHARTASAALCAVPLLAACANDPAYYPHGEQAASSTEGSVLRTLLVYVVVPLGLMVLIAALAWLPGMRRGSRYRPAYGWSAAPVWFAGPSDPVAAVEQAHLDDGERGGSGGSW